MELEARTVTIDRLELMSHAGDRSLFEAECGKGTYVRAVARDMGRALGCLGHVSALRRTRVGPFGRADAVTLEALRGADEAGLARALEPVSAGLGELPSVAVSRADAQRLCRGQAVLLRGRDAPIFEGTVAVTAHAALVALAELRQGELHPRRIFNLAR